MEMEFEECLINFKRLFLKAEKVSNFFNFKSKRFIQWQLMKKKKNFLIKIYLALNWEILSLLVSYALLTLKSILKRYSGD